MAATHVIKLEEDDVNHKVFEVSERDYIKFKNKMTVEATVTFGDETTLNDGEKIVYTACKRQVEK